jgi:hypothetical protein
MRSALILALLATSAFACSVPVFRYALEHWAADGYQVEIAHRGPLSEGDRALVAKLKGSSFTNIAVKEVQSTESSPRVVVKLPASIPAAREVWSAPLNAATVDAVLDSPMRQEIATKLGDGDSGVWVMLESGDKAKDDATAKVLAEELENLASTLALPQLDDQDIKNGLVSVPDEGLRLSFEVLRLSRDNAAEQLLVHTLLATEPDLKDLRGEPMVFPVFGRGRVLYALVGRGINANNLATAAKFLIGSCSCQIKEQNPGMDLLMTADWKTLLKTDKLLDEHLPTLEEIKNMKPILVPIPERPAAKVEANATASGLQGVPVITIAGVLGLLVVAVLIVRARRK